MEIFIKEGILHYLNFSNFGTYVDYIKRKLPTRVRKEKGIRKQNVLELIHSNVNGLSTLSAMDGYKYFTMFIDDYPRFG